MTRDIIHAVEIATEPKAVFDAIATKSGLASFWTADVEGDEAEGGTLTFGFPQAPIRMPIVVSKLDAPTEIIWDCPAGYPFWEGTRVSWSLATGDGGTKVVFRHTGFPDEQPEFDFGSVGLTWGLIVARLKEVLEAGVANPFFGQKR
jgi:uncharacterized protein YndB with AHSA1/START domain